MIKQRDSLRRLPLCFFVGLKCRRRKVSCHLISRLAPTAFLQGEAWLSAESNTIAGTQSLPLEGKVPNGVRRMRWHLMAAAGYGGWPALSTHFIICLLSGRPFPIYNVLYYIRRKRNWRREARFGFRHWIATSASSKARKTSISGMISRKLKKSVDKGWKPW